MEDEISLQNNIEESDHYKKKSFLRNCENYFADYSSKTSVYGIKYIGEPNRPLIEKLYWFVVVFALFITCTVLIAQTWQKWNESPIINFAQRSTPTWQIPFPAVTICSETKVKQRQYNFTNYFQQVVGIVADGLTDDEKKTFADTALVCDNHLYNKGDNTTTHNVIDHLTDVAPRLEEMISMCKVNTVNESCTKIFSPIFTDDGLCFTYNMLDQDDFFTDAAYLHNQKSDGEKKSDGWTLENGYPTFAKLKTYPRRALAEGTRAGMYLLLKANSKDLDFICRGPIQGFKVILHHPAETPRLETKFIQVPLNQSLVIMVEPEMTTTSASLRSYKPEQRNCYFNDEKSLKFFKTYTQHSCYTECVANYTLAKCGCVAFYMPHENSTKICGSGRIPCMHEAHKELIEQEADLELSRLNTGDIVDVSKSCNCLPSCTSITYKTDISHTDLHWQQLLESFKIKPDTWLEGILFSRLTIFLKEKQFVSTERRTMYDATDFLANCGGLLSLFIGFSIFSIFEIIYFLTVRLAFNIQRYGKQFWSGSRQLEHDPYYPR